MRCGTFNASEFCEPFNLCICGMHINENRSEERKMPYWIIII